MTKQPVHQQNCEVQINLCLFKKEEINRRYHVLYYNDKFTVSIFCHNSHKFCTFFVYLNGEDLVSC